LTLVTRTLGNEATLTTPVEFLKESPKGAIISRIQANTGSKVKILLESEKSVFAEFRSHHLWVSLEKIGRECPPSDLPKSYTSSIDPNWIIEEKIPFQITARISSLKHYPPIAGKPDIIIPADFCLVWGPYNTPEFQSKQMTRRAMARLWRIPNTNPSHYWRNFHLVSDSQETTDKILECKKDQIITLEGALTKILYKETLKPAWTSSFAMGFCPLVTVHNITIH